MTAITEKVDRADCDCTRECLQAALLELGERLGIGPIELDGNDGCLLMFNDDVPIDVELAFEASGFYLSGVVGELGEENREAVLSELLEANLQGRGTGAAFFSLDGDVNEIVLNRYVEQEHIDVDLLETELERFLSALTFWRGLAAEGRLGSLRHTHESAGQSPISTGCLAV